MIKKRNKISREELNEKSKSIKKKRKHKGLPSGSRLHQQTSKNDANSKIIQDPRIGSTKKIPLIIDEIKEVVIKKPKIEKVKYSSSAKELEALENDEKLIALLDLVDEGKKLSDEQQKTLDKMLDRIDELMTQLGIEYDDEDEQEEPKENIMNLIRNV